MQRSASTTALATATTDASATGRSSAAFLFRKAGDAAADQTTAVELDDNMVDSIVVEGGEILDGMADYAVEGGEITLAASWPSQFFNETATAGVEAVVPPTLSATFE
ncbi:hypothetical protein F5X96DRAFT_667912 [Biscogniauxia mediterranea]|nr:hypothetical protein F5X96DRAFT_667912 [Biscogniauxia mediterranea]